MINRIINLATKELIQLRRDWLMLLFIILGPISELVLLAHATGQGIRSLPAVIVDQDHSQISRQIAIVLDNTEELEVVAWLDSPDEIEGWLQNNRATLATLLPRGLQADLAARSPHVLLIVDGTNSIVAASVLSAASGAINTLVARRMLAASGVQAPIELRMQARYNPTLNVRHFTITAQLGFIVYQVTLLVAALGIARERELGTLEQLLVTPLQRVEFIIGKAIPAMVVAGGDFVIMWAITRWGLDVPMRGSFALLLGLSLVFIAAEIGWGLVISAVSHTQQQAVLMVFVLALVDVSFSGYLVPVERMPLALRAMAQLFPLQHYLVIIRQIMLKGASLTLLWQQVIALIGLGLVSSAIAAISLRRRLD